MADRPEATTNETIQFASYPGAAEALEVARATPEPFAKERREATIGAVLTGIIAAAEIAADATMTETGKSAAKVMNGILDDYTTLNAQDHTELTYTSPAAHDGGAPVTRRIVGPATVNFALERLDILVNGAGEELPPELSPNALEAAGKVLAKLPDLPAAVVDIMQRKVLAGAAWGMVQVEREQLVRTINGEHHGLYRLADTVQEHYQQNETLRPEHIKDLLGHLGLNQHVEAVIEHLPATLLNQAQRIPVVGELVKKAVGITSKLRDKRSEIELYINAETDNAVHGLIHLRPGQLLNTANMRTAMDALEDIAAFLGPKIIPTEVNRAELAQALLALSVLEDPAATFSASSDNVLNRQIAQELIFFALFDLAEDGRDSSIKTAQQLAQLARATSAAATAGALTVHDEVSGS